MSDPAAPEPTTASSPDIPETIGQPAIDTSAAEHWTIGPNTLRPTVSDAAVYTVGSGGIAAPGAPEHDGCPPFPALLVAGVYTGTGPEQSLLEGPNWTRITIDPVPRDPQWSLDLKTGVLHRGDGIGNFHSFRFACAQRPGVMVLRAETRDSRIEEQQPPLVVNPDPAAIVTELQAGSLPPPGTRTSCVRVGSANGGAIAAAAAQRRTASSSGERLDRVAAFAADHPDGGGVERARHALSDAWSQGVEGLLTEQRAAWARRWASVGIELPDDPETELAVRFAVFQLWSNAGAHGESAVGARGISGAGYRGHVFWDADAFVLPAMASIDPAAAEAMLTYRLARLQAARRRARAEGYRGARFPWESAADGTDVTPRIGFLGGAAVPISTGTREEHITADVAWAADHYAEWTGRPEYLRTAARDLLIETARYWASRLRIDAAGRAHLDEVIGPDEYHESVDDNVFTNLMARWNLRRAARLEPRDAGERNEFSHWRELAHRIVDQLGTDGRYEQFSGYFDLEPLLANEFGRTTLAADVLLGRQRVSGSQLIKQPDALMLHYLVPEEVAPGSLIPNLDFYGPRTTHGSSLSPAVMAALLARAGRPDAALAALRPALRLDLDDRTASTASGLHLATLAGVWQAVLTGFGGVRVRDGVLGVRPVLPRGWSRLGLAFRCLGRAVRLDITPDGVGIRSDGPLTVTVGEAAARTISGEFCWLATKAEGS